MNQFNASCIIKFSSYMLLANRAYSFYSETYQHADFNGTGIIVVENAKTMSIFGGGNFWNERVSSVKVRKGPNWDDPLRVKLFRDVNFGGGSIELDIGDYPHLSSAPFHFNDQTSSVYVRAPCEP